MYLWFPLLGRFHLVRKGYSTFLEPGEHVRQDLHVRRVAAGLDCRVITEPYPGNFLGESG